MAVRLGLAPLLLVLCVVSEVFQKGVANEVIDEARKGTGDAVCMLQHPAPISTKNVANPLVYVLTIKTTLGRERLASLSKDLPKLGIKSFVTVLGLKASDYHSIDELGAAHYLLTDQRKGLWENVKQIPKVRPGTLACSMGHFLIWQMAAEALAKPGAPKFAVILEDDATVNATVPLHDALAEVSADADIAFIDNRHCKDLPHGPVGEEIGSKAYGSAGYAITLWGALALLEQQFSYQSDLWLNIALKKGIAKGYCASPVFLHDMKKQSERLLDKVVGYKVLGSVLGSDSLLFSW